MTDTPRLPSVEDLTGHELRVLKKTLGQPFLSAIDSDFEDAAYAYVWVGERRSDPGLKLDAVLDRPFSEIVKAFEEANVDEDPTSAESGSN